MRKASSESDSIAGFGESGNVTRHYTENGSFIGQYAQDTSQRERFVILLKIKILIFFSLRMFLNLFSDSSVRSGHSPEDEPVADLKTFGPTN